MEWTKETVTQRMAEVNNKGFIAIPGGMFRRDDGIVGQVLEREFNIHENNLHIADLGTYELKGIRKNKNSKLTLFHKTSTAGMSPRQIFERFCYEKPSNRDGSLKRKLFTTIKGSRKNNLGLLLKAQNGCKVDLFYDDDYLATWELSNGEQKIHQVLLAIAETRGATNSRDEEFHYVEAYILSEPKDIYEAITAGAVVMEFNIDQPADRSKAPHDRGPHIRLPVKKLNALFCSVERIL